MAKKKLFVIKIDPEEVMHTSIYKTKGGYNSARIVVKKGNDEFMSISYEWQGDGIPSFAMDLMGFMQANEMKVGGTVEGMEEAYKAYSEREEEEGKDAMPGVCKNCGLADRDCVCDGEKQLEKTREKKGKEKKV